MKFTQSQKAKVISRKIKSQFPTTPEVSLFFAIVDRAIRDRYMGPDKAGANKYLAGRIIHAELCGVEADWTRSTIRKIDEASE